MSRAPAGLSDGLVEISSGGEGIWRELPPLKHYTNAFIWNRNTGKILLGMKKRGFGAGLFNGFGGKVEPGETPRLAAIRELKEEAGIDADLELCGILVFANEGQAFTHYIHVFSARDFFGEPTESDEMKPEWFAVPDEFRANPKESATALAPIPFNNMWEDDRLWFPIMFSGKKFEGRVEFSTTTNEDGSLQWIMGKWWFGTYEKSL